VRKGPDYDYDKRTDPFSFMTNVMTST